MSIREKILVYKENENNLERAIFFRKLAYFSLIIGIGFILLPKMQARIRSCQSRKEEILSAINSEMRLYLNNDEKILKSIYDQDTYLVHSTKSRILAIVKNQLDELKLLRSEGGIFPIDRKEINQFGNRIFNIAQNIQNYNKEFVQRRIGLYQSFFKKSPFPLDVQQKIAIITDDTHNLVVAGAGSGKTEVLTTRIGYLVEREPDSINPEKILALAYQNTAKQEIIERLKSRYGLDVKIKTFHALGWEILSEYFPDNPPRLKFSGDNQEVEYQRYIEYIVSKLMKSLEFQRKILNFASRFGDNFIEKKETEFSRKVDFYEYMNLLKYTALNGIKVKSKAERDIFNFFLTHKLDGRPIKILYESHAQWMEYRDEKGKPNTPRPDFYFPDYFLYLEHWAIDRDGNVPDWFGGNEPSETYQKNMNLKKQKFKSQRLYTLIETYNWEYYSQDFLKVLEDRFINQIENLSPNHQPEITEMSFEEIIQSVYEDCKASISDLSKNIAIFIQIAKTYNLTPEKIQNRLGDESWTARQFYFASLALDAFNIYEDSLRRNNQIDFQDMINLAIKTLKENNDFYKGRYEQILIDEYQDISTQRYDLIKVIMSKSENCKLFCVGDDWQSIMGFSGSNLELFTNFGDYFDNPAITLLGTNYRCCKSIVDLGAEIIKRNENFQIQKITTAYDQSEHPIEVFSSRFDDQDYVKRYDQMLNHVIESIKEYQKYGYSPEDFLILARILKPTMILDRFRSLTRQYNIPKYDSRIMTIHKSKGLQARVVFLLDMVKGLYGFPCEKENPDIFDPAICGRRRDHLEEERRIFYVAATRAKEDLKIYTMKSGQSEFLTEVFQHLKINEL